LIPSGILTNINYPDKVFFISSKIRQNTFATKSIFTPDIFCPLFAAASMRAVFSRINNSFGDDNQHSLL
jgi:hypothetical protein